MAGELKIKGILEEYMKEAKEKRDRHPTVADCFTMTRIVGAVLMLFAKPLSAAFYVLYSVCGISDALDGTIARATGTASRFGAKLDSVADLMFYAAMLFRILPILWEKLPGGIWYAVGLVLLVRALAYLTAAVKYKCFASLHTWMNKLTGLVLFPVPYILLTKILSGYCAMVCGVALTASAEELLLHLSRTAYDPNAKTVFKKRQETKIERTVS